MKKQYKRPQLYDEEGKEEDITRFSRKIFVRQDEWFHSSDFSSSDIASLNICKLDPSWIPRGMIAIPCLAEVGAKGVYSFEVHTDISGIKVTELADAKTKTNSATITPPPHP